MPFVEFLPIGLRPNPVAGLASESSIEALGKTSPMAASADAETRLLYPAAVSDVAEKVDWL